LSAEALDDDVRITLPDGKTVCSADADIDDVLSALLNEPVALTATPLPGASLDRAVPEAVLRGGVKAQVPAEVIEIGAGAPPGTFIDFAASSAHHLDAGPYRRAQSVPAGPPRALPAPTSSSAPKRKASPRTTGSTGSCASATNSSCA
jgi:hypothetical protein